VAALWLIARFRVSSKYADPGKVALDALEQAPRFNKWMYDVVRPYLGQRVAELGSGRGNLSKLLKDGRQLLATDYRVDYVNELRERWGEMSSVHVSQIDLRESISYEVVRRFRPDTVVCLNVLEHIQDDQAVLNNLHSILPRNARMVFLVPYNPKLTSEFDRQIGHFRRYARKELESKMTRAGFMVERQIYFNKVGVFAWWIGNTLMRQRTITTWQLRIYNFLTPIFRVLDKVLPFSGLSTIVVARQGAELRVEETSDERVAA
jgi:phospholipid N-methyltransferase